MPSPTPRRSWLRSPLTNSTTRLPARGWDVRTLLNHVVSGNWWAARSSTATRSSRSATSSTATCSAGRTPSRRTTSQAVDADGSLPRGGAIERAVCGSRTGPCRARSTAATASSTCSCTDGISRRPPANPTCPTTSSSRASRCRPPGRDARGERHVRPPGRAARARRSPDPAAGHARPPGLSAWPNVKHLCRHLGPEHGLHGLPAQLAGRASAPRPGRDGCP